MSRFRLSLAVAVATAILSGGLAAASAVFADPAPIPVTIRDHKFIPAEIHVPANQPTVLQVTNADPLAEEFDSPDLKVEKVIPGGQTGIVRLRPLKPGRYTFSGEYHAKTAQGVVISQ